MRFLRTVSTQRLLAIIAGLVIAAVAGTAIAVAAGANGPVPPRESLAQALHQAASAPAVSGISARISFTNNLIASSDIQGSDPLLNGASGRLWVSNDGRLRLELQGANGDAQVVVNNGSFSIYDPMTNTDYKGTLPQRSGSSSGSKSSSEAIPTVAQIQSDINQFAQHWNLVGPTPRNVAGQPAYKIKITPKHSGGLLGQVQLAWDAARGVPLGIAIYSTSSSTPVLELKATSISYGKVPVSDFNVSAPPDAHVVRIASTATGTTAAAKRADKAGKGRKAETQITGAAAVQAHLPFTLSAPASVDGLQQQSVQLLDWGGSPAALVTYGEGLGGIAVIQRSASGQSSSSSSSSSSGGDQQGLSLPTVSINGATGTELATALGTVIQFSKGGVDYTVLGSVPPIAAENAAKTIAP